MSIVPAQDQATAVATAPSRDHRPSPAAASRSRRRRTAPGPRPQAGLARRAAGDRRALRGVRALRHPRAAHGPYRGVQRVRSRPVRGARLLPGQRLHRAGIAGAQGQPPELLARPAVPPVPALRDCHRGGAGAARARLCQCAGHQRQRHRVGVLAPVHAQRAARRDQHHRRALDAVLRDGVLRAAHRAVHRGPAQAQRVVRRHVRRGRAAARRAAAHRLDLVQLPRAHPGRAGRRCPDHGRHRGRGGRPRAAPCARRVACGGHRPDPGRRQRQEEPLRGTDDPGPDVHRHHALPGPAGAGRPLASRSRGDRHLRRRDRGGCLAHPGSQPATRRRCCSGNGSCPSHWPA